MLTGVISWSLRHRVFVLLGAFGIAVAGYYSLTSINIDAFPDTTPIQVQINTVAPALVPEEVERQITFPVELAMGGMPGLESLRSVSQFGLSQVVVTFSDGTNIYFARQLINERLGTVEIPPGIDRPEMGPVSTGLGEVFQYMVLGQDKDMLETRTLHDWTIKPTLRAVPGTAEINSFGGLKKQYQVRIDPSRLLKYDLTFDQVTQAIPINNLNVGGGHIHQSGDSVLVHGVGRTVNVEQIMNIVITAKDGIPIRIRDVAEVTIGHEIRRGIVTANGQGEVVLGLGYMLMGENSYAYTNRLRDQFDQVNASLPAGVTMVPLYDRTELVDRVIKTVKNNLFEGAYLVILILFLLLGNLRAGLIVAAAIPFSMLFAFSGMLYFGIAASLLSLGALDFGLVVDSSVVMIENVVRRLSHSDTVRTKLEIVREACLEVAKPSVFGVMIIMIVYLPILTLQGVEGKMFRPMALTVMFALLGSLILSLTMVPVLASLFLSSEGEEHEILLVRIAKAIYSPLLNFGLRHQKLAVVVALCSLVVAVKLAMGLGAEFVPRLSEGGVVIGVVRAPGTSLEESRDVNTRMEQILLKEFPNEVAHVWSRVGAPEVATDAGNVEITDLFVALKPRDQWTRARNQNQLVEQMLAEVEDIKGQIVWFTQPIEQRINEMVSGVRADVALKLFGNEFDTLIPKAQELQNVLRSIDGCADLTTEQVMGQPILKITINQDAIARYGLPADSVLDVVESVSNKVLGEVVEGQLRFPLVARLPDELRSNPQTIGSILLTGPSGERISLSQIADIRLVTGPKMITREWGKRRVTVQCNVRGRDVGSFVTEAQRKIAAEVELPADKFRIDWGGQFENLQRASGRLQIVVPVSLILVFIMLNITFRSMLDSVLVFASVPFACVGGIISLVVRDLPFSISAAVGFIALSGISVLNSLVLVQFFRDLIHEGQERLEAIRTAAMTRLRPVLMTALVASVGFVPMALSDGAGAEVQRPLATVVIGGVISSTMMTLLVLPALYALVTSRFAKPVVPAATPTA
ncbi:MAG: efflux RND transporter permease subunit [Planctomycetes bacterium]|nr:efflux RND transporter permease subunit [Planctomycetota bacterium]